MNILIVGFEDSLAPTIKTRLVATLKSQNSWARLSPSVYAVTTPMTAAQFRDHIVANVNGVGRFFVYTVNNQYWATSGLPSDVNKWLQSNWSQS